MKAMKRLQAIRTRLRRNQRGFTLIEMLVVISILGILAAVVTLSMVGVTQFVRNNALNTEKTTVQTALDSLATSVGQTPDQLCAANGSANSPGSATANMSAFPNGTNSVYGNNGAFIRQQTTQQKYYCDPQTGIVNAG